MFALGKPLPLRHSVQLGLRGNGEEGIGSGVRYSMTWLFFAFVNYPGFQHYRGAARLGPGIPHTLSLFFSHLTRPGKRKKGAGRMPIPVPIPAILGFPRRKPYFLSLPPLCLYGRPCSGIYRL